MQLSGPLPLRAPESSWRGAPYQIAPALLAAQPLIQSAAGAPTLRGE
jgi:hypothetical protein